ncbi:hypothetical protein KFK09_006851 [Dendrobium nobile]|uniref:Uncharacterized protein n=1 Tax=Dendrobium nobile TaxID=94219 RepID=A0A8T3BQ95_DENNO|nr:hypothetical protein KFK09_006851 [Dendrobium nobile]
MQRNETRVAQGRPTLGWLEASRSGRARDAGVKSREVRDAGCCRVWRLEKTSGRRTESRIRTRLLQVRREQSPSSGWSRMNGMIGEAGLRLTSYE